MGDIDSYATVYTDPSHGQTEVIERFYAELDVQRHPAQRHLLPRGHQADLVRLLPGTKIRWEYYFGVENVFANLYTPKTNKSFDPFTGEELSGSGQADFTIGFPIPSFGFKLSY